MRCCMHPMTVCFYFHSFSIRSLLMRLAFFQPFIHRPAVHSLIYNFKLLFLANCSVGFIGLPLLACFPSLHHFSVIRFCFSCVCLCFICFICCCYCYFPCSVSISKRMWICWRYTMYTIVWLSPSINGYRTALTSSLWFASNIRFYSVRIVGVKQKSS